MPPLSPPSPPSEVLFSALSLSRRCADAAVRARLSAADACDPDARAVFVELAEFYDLLGAHAFLVAHYVPVVPVVPAAPPEPPARPWWAFWRSFW